ncbi:alpha/beta hydrolase [Nocardioides caldifontis]|uniref:alpha/beta hydrolase n=1 Tax=Nocardioides caldifontis TaxID=2588938 RepID=UPI0011DFDC0D|nr:alpha/beta fold hydrolase [Nocardioides caldifontis]
MSTVEVAFRQGSQLLAGTVLEPADAVGAALVLPGSGPVDRNSDHRRMRLGVTRQLAEAFHDAGITTLRFDKRGVGGSPGDWRSAGLVDNVDDAEAALDHLAAAVGSGLPLFVVGHSEGAVLATALAARRPELAGLVLLAGSARNGEEVLRWQAEQLLPMMPAPLRAVMRLLRVDPAERIAKNRERLKGSTGDVVRVDLVRHNARWFREFMAYEPAEALRRTRVPVLAVSGGKDLQVPPDELLLVEEAAAGPVTTRLVPDLTHTLRRQPRKADLRHYRREATQPVDRELLELVTSWVRDRT